MRVNTQPGRKAGPSKCIFCEQIQDQNVQTNENGDVIISITADDIYTKNSKQRYQITLTMEEVGMLTLLLRQPVPGKDC